MAKTLLLCWLLLLSGSLLASPPRVITLSPHLTELAFAAGITPIAVSAWSDYPPQAKQIEQVANWQGIKAERILQLKPDLVLAWRGGNPQRQIDQLQQLGVPVKWIDPLTLDEMFTALADLGHWSPQTGAGNSRCPPVTSAGSRAASALCSSDCGSAFFCNLVSSPCLPPPEPRCRMKLLRYVAAGTSLLTAASAGRRSAVSRC
ncbi:Vitamin B12-binding protein precursor [Pantoea agglomerans]|uniref:Vitamin B12-binding protein n=1 Tax=Enterobacter agglomerans TaxID=549 RepID=A0A379AK92_ENTAG|nr:Vitamin B12-binding protein precursor [Pantoea agglomerans]